MEVLRSLRYISIRLFCSLVLLLSCVPFQQLTYALEYYPWEGFQGIEMYVDETTNNDVCGCSLAELQVYKDEAGLMPIHYPLSSARTPSAVFDGSIDTYQDPSSANRRFELFFTRKTRIRSYRYVSGPTDSCHLPKKWSFSEMIVGQNSTQLDYIKDGNSPLFGADARTSRVFTLPGVEPMNSLPNITGVSLFVRLPRTAADMPGNSCGTFFDVKGGVKVGDLQLFADAFALEAIDLSKVSRIFPRTKSETSFDNDPQTATEFTPGRQTLQIFFSEPVTFGSYRFIRHAGNACLDPDSWSISVQIDVSTPDWIGTNSTSGFIEVDAQTHAWEGDRQNGSSTNIYQVEWPCPWGIAFDGQRCVTAVPTSIPSTMPSGQPTGQPSGEPSSVPSVIQSPLTIIDDMVKEMAEIDDQVSSTLQVPLYAHALVNDTVISTEHDTCLAWDTFRSHTRALASHYVAHSISVSTFTPTDSVFYFAHHVSENLFVCNDPAIVRELTTSVALSPDFFMHTFECRNGAVNGEGSTLTWGMRRCPGSAIQKICVGHGCDRDPDSFCEGDRLDDSLCIPMYTSLTGWSEIGVIRVSFTEEVHAPRISRITLQGVDIRDSDIIVRVELENLGVDDPEGSFDPLAPSARGLVYCKAYAGGAPLSTTELMVENIAAVVTERYEATLAYPRSKLTSATMYMMYCLSVSSTGTRLSLSDATFASASVNFTTPCCKSLTLVAMQKEIALSFSHEQKHVLELTLGAMPSRSISLVVTASYISTLDGQNTGPRSTDELIFSPSSIHISARDAPTLSFPLALRTVSSARFRGFYDVHVNVANGSSADEFVSQSGTIRIKVVAPNGALSPPRSMLAQFTTDGTAVVVTFDSVTNRAGRASGRFACRELFVEVPGGMCAWLNDYQVRIPARSLSVGGTLQLVSSVALRARCDAKEDSGCDSWSSSSSITTNILAPRVSLIPDVRLNVADVIQPCMNLTLDSYSSTGSGGRPWSMMSWNVSSNDPVAERFTKLHAYLTALHDKAQVVIPYTLFGAGYTYMFYATRCSFLGACGVGAKLSRIALHTLDTTLTVSIDGLNSLRSVKSSDTVRLSATAGVVQCQEDGTRKMSTALEKQDVIYKWSISDNSGHHMMQVASISKDPSKFVIPSDSLTPGAYVVTVFVSSSSSSRVGSASIDLYVQLQALEPVIRNAYSIGLRPGSKEVLDARASLNPNLPVLRFGDILFRWSCRQILPFYDEMCPGLVLDWRHRMNSTIEVTYNHSHTLNEVTVTVESFRSIGSIASTQIFVRTLDSDSAPLIKMYGPPRHNRVSVDHSLVIHSAVLRDDEVACAWETFPDSTYLSSFALTPLSLAFPSPSRSLIDQYYNFDLMIPAGLLHSYADYTFTVTCAYLLRENSTTVTESLLVSSNDVPKPGYFTVSPQIGCVILDSFHFAASFWEDDDFPLRYAFGIVADGRHIDLSSRSEVPRFDAFMSHPRILRKDNALNVSVYLKVFDIHDGTAETTLSVVLQECDLPSSNRSRHIHEVVAMKMLSQDAKWKVKNPSDNNQLRASLMMHVLASNAVNCSHIPLPVNVHESERSGMNTSVLYSNCSEINRQDCDSTAYSCGECFPGFHSSGFIHAANTPCERIPEEGIELRRGCEGNCSSNGICQISSPYVKDRSSLSCPLSENANSCTAFCVCDDGFAGSTCQYTTDEMEMRQSTRVSLVETCIELFNFVDPFHDEIYDSLVLIDVLLKRADEVDAGALVSLLMHLSEVLTTVSRDSPYDFYAPVIGNLLNGLGHHHIHDIKSMAEFIYVFQQLTSAIHRLEKRPFLPISFAGSRSVRGTSREVAHPSDLCLFRNNSGTCASTRLEIYALEDGITNVTAGNISALVVDMHFMRRNVSEVLPTSLFVVSPTIFKSVTESKAWQERLEFLGSEMALVQVDEYERLGTQVSHTEAFAIAYGRRKAAKVLFGAREDVLSNLVILSVKDLLQSGSYVQVCGGASEESREFDPVRVISFTFPNHVPGPLKRMTQSLTFPMKVFTHICRPYLSETIVFVCLDKKHTINCDGGDQKRRYDVTCEGEAVQEVKCLPYLDDDSSPCRAVYLNDSSFSCECDVCLLGSTTSRRYLYDSDGDDAFLAFHAVLTYVVKDMPTVVSFFNETFDMTSTDTVWITLVVIFAFFVFIFSCNEVRLGMDAKTGKIEADESMMRPTSHSPGKSEKRSECAMSNEGDDLSAPELLRYIYATIPPIFNMTLTIWERIYQQVAWLSPHLIVSLLARSNGVYLRFVALVQLLSFINFMAMVIALLVGWELSSSEKMSHICGDYREKDLCYGEDLSFVACYWDESYGDGLCRILILFDTCEAVYMSFFVFFLASFISIPLRLIFSVFFDLLLRGDTAFRNRSNEVGESREKSSHRLSITRRKAVLSVSDEMIEGRISHGIFATMVPVVPPLFRRSRSSAHKALHLLQKGFFAKRVVERKHTLGEVDGDLLFSALEKDLEKYLLEALLNYDTENIIALLQQWRISNVTESLNNSLELTWFNQKNIKKGLEDVAKEAYELHRGVHNLPTDIQGFTVIHQLFLDIIGRHRPISRIIDVQAREYLRKGYQLQTPFKVLVWAVVIGLNGICVYMCITTASMRGLDWQKLWLKCFLEFILYFLFIDMTVESFFVSIFFPHQAVSLMSVVQRSMREIILNFLDRQTLARGGEMPLEAETLTGFSASHYFHVSYLLAQMLNQGGNIAEAKLISALVDPFPRASFPQHTLEASSGHSLFLKGCVISPSKLKQYFAGFPILLQRGLVSLTLPLIGSSITVFMYSQSDSSSLLRVIMLLVCLVACLGVLYLTYGIWSHGMDICHDTETSITSLLSTNDLNAPGDGVLCHVNFLKNMSSISQNNDDGDSHSITPHDVVGELKDVACNAVRLGMLVHENDLKFLERRPTVSSLNASISKKKGRVSTKIHANHLTKKQSDRFGLTGTLDGFHNSMKHVDGVVEPFKVGNLGGIVEDESTESAISSIQSRQRNVRFTAKMRASRKSSLYIPVSSTLVDDELLCSSSSNISDDDDGDETIPTGSSPTAKKVPKIKMKRSTAGKSKKIKRNASSKGKKMKTKKRKKR